jgi:subtilisin
MSSQSVRRSLVPAVVVLSALVTAPAAVGAPTVVMLRPGADPAAVSRSVGVTKPRLFLALDGFAADISDAQTSALRARADVKLVTPDTALASKDGPNHGKGGLNGAGKAQQLIPTGLRRIGGLASPTAHIDGLDDRVDADVAVMDGGVDLGHPDLNVAGAVNCADDAYKADWHATHIAGIAAAKDNGIGVVGVAPGARIWAVRVFNQQARTNLSALLCGIDWLLGHAATIDVVNFSAGFDGFDDPNCGVDPPDPVHAGICQSVAAGITWVVSAGNDASDTVNVVPAAFDEVITVSALADYDGVPGGLTGQTCNPFGLHALGGDDTFASFSNFGADVDLMAPGVCILSTWDQAQYGTGTGTSMAAPYVAGAAALVRATHPTASPAAVKAALLANRISGHVPGDLDGIDEGLLNVTGF